MAYILGVAAWAAMAALAPTATEAPASRAHADEIVITAKHSGAPMWTVRSDTGTLILVGAIQGVTANTKWDPAALIEAVRKADRVIFPENHGYTASPFAAIGWLAKFNAMGSLPKGQRLSDFASPEDMRRLAALAARGAVRKDYDTRFPLHLANDLRDRARDRVKFGQAPGDYVRRAVKTYKIELVPMEVSKAKPLIQDLFASTPQQHLPCLHAAIALAEAGPAAIQARSDAWAARNVRAVLASPVHAAGETCWPAGAAGQDSTALLDGMKRLIAEPKVTVAVLNLGTLAEPGGVLDSLEAGGFDVEGPRWKD